MRRLLASAAAFALGLATSSASATVNEPNGLLVPLNSNNGEQQLFTFFAGQGEAIDWLADAHPTPDTFSPLCGFSATYMLNEAGSHFGLAWYNANGQAPQPADLHVIIAANSPVGTVITSNDIKNDPAYQGGLVGFALVGGQTHYSEAAWDPVCSGCNPPAPWITGLLYQSKKTANAYYIAFEDGNVSASSFNNDGDFNDDVYFLTGLTCAGGGQPCVTTTPGVCAAGLTECTPNGVTCHGLVAPSAEKCDGVDNDCNGQADDAADLCQTGWVCDRGTCVKACGGGENPCTVGKVCDQASGFCIDPACQGVDCGAGTACVGGTCKAPCDGVTCPLGQECRVGACVDPCAGVTCDAGTACQEGVCLPRCDCQPCAAGLACDTTSGVCVDPACVAVPCGAGTYCQAGQCVDACTGAACPTGQTCTAGSCVDLAPPDGGAGGNAGGGFADGGFGGFPGSGGQDGGGTSEDGGTGGAGAYSPKLGSESAGCGCRTARSSGERGAALAAVGVLLAVRLRRRRRA